MGHVPGKQDAKSCLASSSSPNPIPPSPYPRLLTYSVCTSCLVSSFCLLQKSFAVCVCALESKEKAHISLLAVVVVFLFILFLLFTFFSTLGHRSCADDLCCARAFMRTGRLLEWNWTFAGNIYVSHSSSAKSEATQTQRIGSASHTGRRPQVWTSVDICGYLWTRLNS